MNYDDFIKSKEFRVRASGFYPTQDINQKLFDFQRDIVRWSLIRGKSAVFADCGLGKTPMQLEWAYHVYEHTKLPVIILAPLAVSKQTIGEGVKFGIEVNPCRSDGDVKLGVNITNYEMLHAFDASVFSGVVLDESSILKSFSGKIRTQIIETFINTPYKMACTATPAPNDFMELGNHAQFLNVMTREEMLAMFFINDGGDCGKWRLKGHAQSEFWKWICQWAITIRKPSDLGYNDNGFILPEIHFHEHVVESGFTTDRLFSTDAKTLEERREARKASLPSRVDMAAELANNSTDQWLIWCDLNDESKALYNAISDSIEVKGSDENEHKEQSAIDFTNGKIRTLVSKPSIFGFGLNFQSCHNVIFTGLSDSYEQFYQAVRRCWRFGQKNSVNVHIIISESEGAVLSNIKRKESDAMELAKGMVEHMADISKAILHDNEYQIPEYKIGSVKDKNWEMHLGDCVDVIKNIADDSIGYSIFSPPFASLFTYTNSPRDMGNSKTQEEFMHHFRYLVKEIHRVIMPGRLVSFHCMNLPATITRDGYIGMKDFRGDLIRIFEGAGFIYHSEVCIWKDPLVQATRTKNLTLAHKQISKDSSRCAQGLPDYVVTMRKLGINPEPISHGRGFESYVGEMPEPNDPKSDNPKINKYSHHVWQRYASPVWFDIRQTRTLNERAAREHSDERHICPLQLDTIERCLDLWSNHRDVVLSPFAGIGSEGYCSIRMGRKFIGIELKESYYNESIRNLRKAQDEMTQDVLFG
jgi:hypothetical protein